jgi:hypothetical protein
MRDEFARAFQRYLFAGHNAFLIMEDADRRFVQFTRDGLDVQFDLPSHGLTPEQAKRADSFLCGELGAERVDLADGHFAYQLVVAPDAAKLADLSLAVFEFVYGAPPRAPLNVTIDT